MQTLHLVPKHVHVREPWLWAFRVVMRLQKSDGLCFYTE